MKPYAVDKKTGEPIDLLILRKGCKGIALKALKETKINHKNIRWLFLNSTRVYLWYNEYSQVIEVKNRFKELLEEKGFVID